MDAVYIATPAKTHFQVVSDSLKAGKDVLVEKPMVTSVKEAEELVDLDEKLNRILMVSHTFLYNDAIRKMRSIVIIGDLGSIEHVYSRRTNLGPWIMDVDVLWDIGPHDIAILRYLLGEDPESISLIGASDLKGLPGVCFVNLTFGTGVVGSIHLSWFDFYKTRTVTVVGSKSMVACSDYADREKARLQVQPYYISGRKLLKEQLSVAEIDVSRTLENEVTHFLQCIKERQLPLTNCFEGLSVTRILEHGEKSMRNNGAWEKIAW